MKNQFSAAVLLLLMVVFAASAAAQKEKSKDDLFKEIAKLTNSKKTEDLDKAYSMAKEFVTRFAADKDPRVTNTKAFIGKYRQNLFVNAVVAKKTTDTFALGREILAEEPDNTGVVINLAYMGYTARESGDKAYETDAVTFARKSVELLEAGKLPQSFAPYKDQGETSGWMHFIIGFLSFEKDAKTAAEEAYKAVQFETPIKNDPLPYYMIASYYEDLYTKFSTAKTEPAKTEKAIDLMLDAYARTCKRAEVTKNPGNTQWKERLAQIYKFRKKTDAGLADFIAATDSMPLADPAKF